MRNEEALRDPDGSGAASRCPGASPCPGARRTQHSKIENRKSKIAVLVLTLATAGVRAEDGRGRRFQAVDIPRSTRVQILFEKTARAIELERWRAAVECLQTVVEKYPDRFHEVSPGQFRGARLIALELLSSLPPVALKTYRALYDPVVRSIFPRPGSGDALERLRRIVFLYPMATRGGEAIGVLADLMIERGEFLRAIHYLRRLVSLTTITPGERTSALARLALCLSATGRVRQLAEFLAGVGETARSPLTVSTRKTSLAGFVSGLMRGARGRDLAPAPHAWPIWGGDPSQARAHEPPVPAAHRTSWSQKIPEVPDRPPRREFEFFHGRGFFGQKRPAYPYLPVVVDGKVFVSNGNAVYSYDLHSGDWQQVFHGFSSERKTRPDSDEVYGVTFHRGVLYANLEVPPADTHEDQWRAYVIQGLIPQRRLVAVSPRTGKVLWSQENIADPLVRSMLIPSAPTPAGDTLFVVGSVYEGMASVYCVALDAATGAVRWKTYLGGGQQELNMFGNRVRELFIPPCALGDGRLFAVTSMGIVAALDIESGSLEWAAGYERVPIAPAEGSRVNLRPRTWHQEAPRLTGGRLLVAPLDSEYLTAYDARTGKTLWRVHRDGATRLVGARKGLVYLSGSRVVARDLTTGRLRWKAEFDEDNEENEVAAGRGALCEDRIVVPSSRALYEIDAAEGKRLARRAHDRLGRLPGNLLFIDDTLIVAGNRAMQGTFAAGQVRTRILRSMASRPGDPGPHYQLGRFYLRTGEHRAAAATFRQTLTLSRKRFPGYVLPARRGLFTACKALAVGAWKGEGDPSGAQRLYLEALRHAPSREDRISFLFRFGRFLERTRNTEGVRRVYRELASRHPRLEVRIAEVRLVVGFEALRRLGDYLAASGRPAEALLAFQTILEDYPGGHVALRTAPAFARQRIARLLEEHGQGLYAALEARAQALFDEASKGPSTILLERILQVYPNSKLVPQCTFRLARALAPENPQRVADLLRRFMARYPTSRHLAVAHLLLADCYERLRMFTAAKASLERVARGWAGVRVQYLGREVDAGRIAEKRLGASRYRRTLSASTRPALRIPRSPRPVWTLRLPGGMARLLDPQGVPPRHALPFFYVARGPTIECRVAGTGKVAWRRHLGGRVNGCGYSGARLVVWSNRGVVSLEPDRGKIHWSRSLGVHTASHTDEVMAIIADRENASHGQRQLHLIDSSAGKDLWSQTFAATNPPPPLISGDYVIVHTRHPTALNVFRLTTGSRLPVVALSRESLRSRPVVVGPSRIVFSPSAGRVVLRDVGRGSDVWVQDTSPLFWHTLVANEKWTCFADARGRVHVLSTRTGKRMRITAEDRDRHTVHQASLDWNYLATLGATPDGKRTLFTWNLDTDRLPRSFDLAHSQDRSIAYLHLGASHVLVLYDSFHKGESGFKLHLFLVVRDSGARLELRFPPTGIWGAASVTTADGGLVVAKGDRMAFYRG